MGYLVKDMMVAEILKIIRRVMSGRRSIPPAIAAKLAEHTPRIALTPREIEVTLAHGDGSHERTDRQPNGRTEETVKVHVKNILQKLDARDRTAAVTIAVRRGFIRLDVAPASNELVEDHCREGRGATASLAYVCATITAVALLADPR